MQPLDFVVLVTTMVAVSAYGILKSRSKVENNAKDFVVGSDMSAWSVALSVCSGFISSISLLGFPSEVFYNGPMIIWYAIMYVIAFPIVAYVFLPVTYNLRLTSAYEYFELRFNRTCRSIAAGLFCTEILLYNAVALYAPSVAISALLDVHILISILLTAALAATYISAGGAKAGIHTSAAQMVLIVTSMTLIVAISMWKEDTNKIVDNVIDGNRARLMEFRPDPRIRHSAYSLVFGGTGTILALFAANQMSLQKYMSMPTLKMAQKVVLLNIPCNFFILFVYVIIGLIIFGVYHDCVPVLNSKNELLPYYVLDRMSDIPGFTGMFAVAIYSAGISTLSSTFSSGNAVVIEDIIVPLLEIFNMPNLNDKTRKLIMRIFPIALAIFAIGLALVCSILDSLVLQLAFSIFGVVGGPVLGLFILGVLVPYVKERAATIAFIISIIASFGTAIGAFYNKVTPIALHLNTYCNTSFSYSIANNSMYNTVTEIDGWWGLQYLRISYQYYSLVGVITSLLVGITAQAVLKSDSELKVDSRLLSPILHTSNANNRENVSS
ncbi:hypothetical protein PRIPAC_95969 [Pristionchus pacificus]|uniref:Uncharacterized protein n=1 Tax=Pristionchus pacificus TaxID=54126 RepID=A0A2A6D2C6_PRIPA|nr:hypothetical protein PRIPAC_95969 [Pristionchus pacificus]|eukprot:PDM84457.1 hypothetical protein PRIPAC_33480 [Pristionchus pacificus]